MYFRGMTTNVRDADADLLSMGLKATEGYSVIVAD